MKKKKSKNFYIITDARFCYPHNMTKPEEFYWTAICPYCDTKNRYDIKL